MNNRSRMLTFWFGITTALLFLAQEPVGAHTEGKMQLSAAPAGPFKMTVFTSPDPAEVGEIHVAALIFTAQDASPVLDGEVTVTMAPLGGKGGTLTVPAVTGDSENKLLFEAILEPSEPGLYQVSVAVTDPQGNTGEASFELDVASGGGINWLFLIPVIVALVAALVWIINRIRGRDPSSIGSE